MMLQIIRRPELVKRMGLTNSGLDRAIRDGFVPPPVKLSPDPTRRAVGWPAHEADEVIAARIAGLDPEATRELVASLLARRSSTVALRQWNGTRVQATADRGGAP
jgi:predicted DNA-binding transcriptional regulator AlpA